MPEYTLAGILVLAGALAFAVVAGAHRECATWLGFLAFLAMTVMFDWLLTGLPIVTYGAATRSGLAIGPIPVEDLLYGQALYLVAVAAWGIRPARSGPARRRAAGSGGAGSGAAGSAP